MADQTTAPLERVTQLLERSMTPADIAERLELVISSDHALYLERRRRVIHAAAAELERAARDAGLTAASEPYPRVAVMDALRDWIRDDVPGFVLDAGEPRLKADWRLEKIRRRDAGEPVRDRVGWRAWEDSIPNALSMLCREVLGYALAFVDWRAMAMAQLESDANGVTLEQLAQTLAAIRELETGDDADPTGTGIAAPFAAERLELSSEELAERVHYLAELGLAGSRFVGGTSGTLVHSTPAGELRL